MQAVILAAGRSKRFYPLCDKYNKTMIPLLGKTILEWTIEAVIKSGIKDIVLVVNQEGADTIPPLEGEPKPKIVIQKEAAGMADGLLKAKEHIHDEFLLLNGYHLDIDEFIKAMTAKKKKADGVILATQRSNPWEFGVLEVSGDKVKGLAEKPPRGSEKSHLCVAGAYLLSKDFLTFLEKFPASHYQLEEAINKYCQEKNVLVEKTVKVTVSLKYPWDLLKLKDYLLERLPAKINQSVKIGKNVVLEDKVIVEDGAAIMENAVIKGPAYIGRNVLVGNSVLIRGRTVIEENCQIGAFSEIKNSLFLPGTHFGGAGFVGSSVIGENCRLGHGFISANKRFDRKKNMVKLKDKKVETGLDDLGIMMGSGVNVGIKVGTMPGKTIGSGAMIYPGVIVDKNIKAIEKVAS